MEEIRYESKEPKSACENDELIFLTKLLEEVLLVFLKLLVPLLQIATWGKYQW